MALDGAFVPRVRLSGGRRHGDDDHRADPRLALGRWAGRARPDRHVRRRPGRRARPAVRHGRPDAAAGARPVAIAIVLDHAAPAPTVLDATSHQRARRFAAEFGIADLFDIGQQGISHQLVLEHALGPARPGDGVRRLAHVRQRRAELRRPRPRPPRDPADRVHRPDLVPGARDGPRRVHRHQAAGHLRQGRVPRRSPPSSAASRAGRSSSRPTASTS